jgi:hypothetical protein
MRSNLANLYVSPPSLDEQIQFMQREIDKQEATLASRTEEGHETTDAKKRLVFLLTTLNDVLRMKIEEER